MERTVDGHGKGGLPWHRESRSNLCLADTECVFLFFVIHLDLPTIEVSLEQLARGAR